MKRFFYGLLAFLPVLIFCGCRINMTAVTRINDDGSGFRITTYSADGASEKDELVNDYLLPGPGEWKLERYAKDNPPVHIYEVKRSFMDMNKLTPDYARKGSYPGNLSSNSFSLKVHNGILFTVYEYEEKFRDCMDRRKAMQFCAQWYGRSLDIAASEIEKEFPGLAQKDGIKAFLDGMYRQYYDFFLREFMSKGRRVFEGEDPLFNAEKQEFEARYGEDSFASSVTAYICSVNKDQDPKKTRERLLKVHGRIDEALSDLGSSLSADNYKDSFGVYGWPVFMDYSFNISVTLPGRMIYSNAQETDCGTAKWRFTCDDFLLNEHVLTAKSRKLNPAGIGFILIILLAAVYSIYNNGGPRQK